jgi:hypothetical protein
MDTYNNDGIVKATASENQKKVEQSQSYRGISSEPLQKYIDEFREELHVEMAGISEIKW